MPSWLLAALGSSLSYGMNNLLLKTMTGRIHGAVGALVIQGVSFAVVAAYLVWLQTSQGAVTGGTATGYAAAVCSGFAQALGILFLLSTFRLGGEVSVAIPVLLVVQIALAAAAGLLVFREPVGARRLAGLALAVAGIWLASGK